MYILNDNIKYYTKEMIKLLRITFVGLLIIMTVILIKYKPMYSIKLGNEEIGYIKEKQDIDTYIEELTNVEQSENIAFIELEEKPEVELKLVSKNTKECGEELKNNIEEILSIEYTTYAITYNGSNTAYVSTMEEAEKVVENIKKEYSSSYTKKLGILQVYSNNIEEIKASEVEDATKKVSKLVENTKNTVKVAKLNTTSNTNSVSKTNTSIFTVKPISGIITSRFGGRASPGGIGSTNHKGLDISSKTGTVIKAAASGTVKFAGYKGSLGNLVIIDSGKGVETYYGHCSKLYVSKGQKVNAGDKIAAVGQTGAATGPHLHFEIHVNGTAVNPQKYLYR